MKNKNPQDERIMAQRRKISSDAFGILLIVLLFSILIQQFLLDAPFEQYAAEFICFIGISFYIIIRYITLGLNIYGEGKRAKAISFIHSITAGLTVAAINGVFNYSRYAEKYKETGIGLFIIILAITFLSAALLTFLVLSFFNFLNTKRQAVIQKQLDEKEGEA